MSSHRRSSSIRWLVPLTVLAVLVSGTPAAAAPPASAVEPAATTVTRVHPVTGVARWVRIGAQDQPAFTRALPEMAARALLRAHGDLFGLRDPDEELALIGDERDAIGDLHFFYEQLHHGVRVFGGDLRVHMGEDGRARSISGVVLPHLDLDPVPSIAAATAEAAAIRAVAKEAGLRAADLAATPAELVVFREGLLQGIDGASRLAWRTEVGNGSSVREDVFVDAQRGIVLERFTRIHEALFRRLFDDNLGNEIWTEGDAFPGGLDVWQQTELEAAGHSYALFDNSFGWTSYDGLDAEMWTIHDDPNIDCPNASWNGLHASYCTGTASDDVVAHEWGHAYTEYTSDLIYAWQTGALNESYSDIWGETVDLLNGYADGGEDLSLRTTCNSSDRWRMGEDASAFGGAIRDLWDPTCDGDPGKVSDNQYRCNSADSGGVHTNSGVSNHAYALLVDGGTYNGQTVSALGFTKAAHLHWRAQSIYETNTSDFHDHSDALEQACTDLLGINLEGLSLSVGAPAGPSGEILSPADCQEVADAIAATEMRDDACPGQFGTLLHPSAPSLCSAGLPTDVELHDFEAGLGAWTVGQIPTNPGTWDSRDWVADSTLPDGRAGTAAFGIDPSFGDCDADLDNGIIYLESPPIFIPPATPVSVRVAFDHYVSTEAGWDGGNLKYSTDGVTFFLVPAAAYIFNAYNRTLNVTGNDNPMAGEAAFSGTDGGTVGGSWGQSQVNLAALGVAPGDTVYLRFEFGTDSCTGYDGWYVDDVHVYGCDPGPCGVAPAVGCKEAFLPAGAGKSLFAVKNASDLSKGTLKWKWNKGESTDLADFLDPVGSGAATYHVCVFDDSVGIQPLFEAAIPSQGACGGKDCWKAAGTKGYRYKDRDGTHASVQTIKLKSGEDGRAQVQVKAKGVTVPILSPPLDLNVTVQLIADDGVTPVCWQTTLTTEKTNVDGSFKATGP